MGIDSIDLINGLDCDYVLLATIDSYVEDVIKRRLIWRGILNDKILSAQCPGETRYALLQKYLSI